MHREDGNSMTVWACPARRHPEAPGPPGGDEPEGSGAEPDYSLGDRAQTRQPQPVRDREPLSEWIR